MTDRYAVVSDGAVANVLMWDGIADLVLDAGAALVLAPSADIGWLYTDGKLTPPAAAEAPALSAAELADLIAVRRYQAESAGITVGGMVVATDRDSQGLITGAALAAMLDSTYACNWKTDDGFVKLDAKTLIAVAQAVRAHIQGCFDREAALLAAVKAGKYTADMLDTGWPS